MTIDELIAKQEITDLSSRYMRGLDRLDPEIMQTVFFDDAVVDYGFFKGSAAEFIDVAQNALKDHHSNHHMIGQVLIKFDNADRAYGEVYFHAYHRVVQNDAPVDLIISGRYLDRYEKRDGVWKMAFRCEVNDWSRTDPAADEYMRTNTQGLVSGRSDDLSYNIDYLNQTNNAE